MTYSAEFLAQVTKSVEELSTSIRQACTFYDINKSTLQNRLKDSSIKLTCNKPPKILYRYIKFKLYLREEMLRTKKPSSPSCLALIFITIYL